MCSKTCQLKNNILLNGLLIILFLVTPVYPKNFIKKVKGQNNAILICIANKPRKDVHGIIRYFILMNDTIYRTALSVHRVCKTVGIENLKLINYSAYNKMESIIFKNIFMPFSLNGSEFLDSNIVIQSYKVNIEFKFLDCMSPDYDDFEIGNRALLILNIHKKVKRLKETPKQIISRFLHIHAPVVRSLPNQ
jgi:hypothetical protein